MPFPPSFHLGHNLVLFAQVFFLFRVQRVRGVQPPAAAVLRDSGRAGRLRRGGGHGTSFLRLFMSVSFSICIPYTLSSFFSPRPRSCPLRVALLPFSSSTGRGRIGIVGGRAGQLRPDSLVIVGGRAFRLRPCSLWIVGGRRILCGLAAGSQPGGTRYVSP
jgi:hypothetical protein